MGDIIGEEQLNSNKLDLLQEVKKYSELIRIYRKKSNKYKIRLECILDCLENKDMEPQLKNKVKKIILSARVSQIQLCSDPNSVKCETQNLLGVPVNNIKLTYSERETLAFFLKYPIDSKLANLKDTYKLSASADNSKQEFFLELPYNDKVLLEYRSKLALNQQEFINNQTQMFAVLEEMMKFRLKTVPELSKIKCKEYEIDILMQEKNSLPALTELIKDMKEQKIEFLRKIDELKDLKKTYEDASCKEYDAILQSYLQYKAVLNRKKQMEALPI
ncbi:uncharacterized protein LOC125503669 [Dendroctonus ponderosae]|uniref:uncharacterized protein LOC125503643 n=1 Tax=Dendroctonus ponderosae TaxID=77166 RepID=UPI00203581DC|nr:uncharacterized protein LOC125503643 [Dendroctonus ponderosae]XP_048520357.1 uncharacterized protein LOC125503669 [Dendroctonus ponderosae]